MSKRTKIARSVCDLEARDCRWPIGDPRHADFHFCAAQKIDGRPYCKEHWQQSLEVAKPRTAANDRGFSFSRRAA